MRPDAILGRKTWPSPTPLNHFHAAVAHHALLEFEHAPQKLKRLWLARLLQPGMVIIETSALLENEAFVVCETDDFGALAWPAVLHAQDGHTWVPYCRVLQ